MRYDLRNSRGPKVIVRHEIEMRFDLVGIIAGQVSSGIGARTFALNLRLLVIRLLIGEILRSGLKELPHQRFLPVRPGLRTRSLAVRQRQQHQRVQVPLVFHDVRKLLNRRRIVEISLLRDI